MTTTLEDLNEFWVPDEVVAATDDTLREAGGYGAECFVLWVGRADHDTFFVHSTYTPQQNAYRLPEGLCVRVDGDELHRLNKWLFASKLVLGAQVHSHPTRAFHSETDSTYPIVTQRGGLSIVVPDFGHRGLRGRGVETYRLGGRGWERLSRRSVRRLVHLAEAPHSPQNHQG